jgi:hypothetical protein
MECPHNPRDLGVISRFILPSPQVQQHRRGRCQSHHWLIGVPFEHNTSLREVNLAMEEGDDDNNEDKEGMEHRKVYSNGSKGGSVTKS